MARTSTSCSSRSQSPFESLELKTLLGIKSPEDFQTTSLWDTRRAKIPFDEVVSRLKEFQTILAGDFSQTVEGVGVPNVRDIGRYYGLHFSRLDVPDSVKLRPLYDCVKVCTLDGSGRGGVKGRSATVALGLRRAPEDPREGKVRKYWWSIESEELDDNSKPERYDGDDVTCFGKLSVVHTSGDRGYLSVACVQNCRLESEDDVKAVEAEGRARPASSDGLTSHGVFHNRDRYAVFALLALMAAEATNTCDALVGDRTSREYMPTPTTSFHSFQDSDRRVYSPLAGVIGENNRGIRVWRDRTEMMDCIVQA